MVPFTTLNFLLVFALVLFLLGIVSTMLGFYMLTARSYGREMKVLASQSAKLGQKALTDNIAALANSTSQLVEAVNSLVRTSTGIGVFFVLIGLLLMSAAYLVVTRSPVV